MVLEVMWLIREREKLIYGSYELKLNGEGEFWANGMQQTKEGGFSTFFYLLTWSAMY